MKHRPWFQVLRVAALTAALSSPAWSTSFEYDVIIDTQNLVGTSGSLLFQLFDNTIPASTEVRVTDVSGITQAGFPIASGNVSGSLLNNDLRIWDGVALSSLLNFGASFGSTLQFTILFDSTPTPNNDMFIFSVNGGLGGVTNLFSFTATNEMTVFDGSIVKVSSVGGPSVTLPEPSAVAELVSLVMLVLTIGLFWRRREPLQAAGAAVGTN